MTDMLHEVIRGCVSCQCRSVKATGNPKYDLENHEDDPEVFNLIQGDDTVFVPFSTDTRHLPFSPLINHVNEEPPQILVHIVHNEDESLVHDKQPTATPEGIVIARYPVPTDGGLPVIRSFEKVELLLSHGEGNAFGLKSSTEGCQTPLWNARSLDRFSSGGWHVRLFTLTHTPDAPYTDSDKAPLGQVSDKTT